MYLGSKGIPSKEGGEELYCVLPHNTALVLQSSYHQLQDRLLSLQGNCLGACAWTVHLSNCSPSRHTLYLHIHQSVKYKNSVSKLKKAVNLLSLHNTVCEALLIPSSMGDGVSFE